MLLFGVDYDQFAEPETSYLYFTGPNCPPCADIRTKAVWGEMKKKEKVVIHDSGTVEGSRAFTKYNVTQMPFLIKYRGDKELGRTNFNLVEGNTISYGAGYNLLKNKK